MRDTPKKTNFYTFLIQAENLLRAKLAKYWNIILEKPELLELICAQSADAVETFLHNCGLDFVSVTYKTTKIKKRDTQVSLVALKDSKPMRLNDLLYVLVPEETFSKLEEWFLEYKPSIDLGGYNSDGSD